MAYYLVRENDRSDYFEDYYSTWEDAFNAGNKKFRPGWFSAPTFEIIKVIDIPTIPDLDVAIIEAYVNRMRMDGYPSEIVNEWRSNITQDDMDSLYAGLKKEFENWLSYTNNIVDYEMRTTEIVTSKV